MAAGPYPPCHARSAHPQDTPLPEGLHAYAALHRRTRVVQLVVWGLAFLWLGFVVYSVLKGTPQ